MSWKFVIVDVSSQVAFSVETFVTHMTIIPFHHNTIFISQVFSLVSYQIAGIGHRLSTDITGEWFFSSVSSEVLSKTLVDRKNFSTNLTVGLHFLTF